MFDSESEVNVILAIAKIGASEETIRNLESLRMILISSLDCAYMMGKSTGYCEGISTYRDCKEQITHIKPTNWEQIPIEDEEDTYEIRKNGDCGDGGSHPSASANHTYDLGKC